MLIPDCYTANFDIKDACYYSNFAKKQKIFKVFISRETCLPDYLSLVPRQFTKLLKSPSAFLRKLLTLMIYLCGL